MANEINTIKKSKNKLLDANSLIIFEHPTSDDFAFMHAILCQVGLPRSKVKGVEFERRNGKASLLVTAGKIWNGKDWILQGVPYGAIPRLFMAYSSTYCIKHKTKEIPIGGNTKKFMELLGLNNSGQSYNAIRKQIKSLAACRIQLGYEDVNYNGQPIEKFDAWLSNEQESLWPGVILLTSSFQETLTNHAVPHDMRALLALRNSTLQMDIYTMLCQRLHRISGKSIFLPWIAIRDQFGQEYKDPKNFKKEFLKALKPSLIVYPQAKVDVVDGGLLLHASSPPIAKL